MSEADTQSNCNSKYITHDLGWKLTAVKWGLSLVMCLVVGCYGAILAAFPVESFQNIKETIFQKMVDTPFGSKGGKLSFVPSLQYQLDSGEDAWLPYKWISIQSSCTYNMLTLTSQLNA